MRAWERPRASLTRHAAADSTRDMLGQVLGHQAPPTRPLDTPRGLTSRMSGLRFDENLMKKQRKLWIFIDISLILMVFIDISLILMVSIGLC